MFEPFSERADAGLPRCRASRTSRSLSKAPVLLRCIHIQLSPSLAFSSLCNSEKCSKNLIKTNISAIVYLQVSHQEGPYQGGPDGTHRGLRVQPQPCLLDRRRCDRRPPPLLLPVLRRGGAGSALRRHLLHGPCSIRSQDGVVVHPRSVLVAVLHDLVRVLGRHVHHRSHDAPLRVGAGELQGHPLRQASCPRSLITTSTGGGIDDLLRQGP